MKKKKTFFIKSILKNLTSVKLRITHKITHIVSMRRIELAMVMIIMVMVMILIMKVGVMILVVKILMMMVVTKINLCRVVVLMTW